MNLLGDIYVLRQVGEELRPCLVHSLVKEVARCNLKRSVFDRREKISEKLEIAN